MKNQTNERNGAWEEPGVIGTRIEIEGKGLTVLWRNSPVLETTFTIKEDDDGQHLLPAKTGLRYNGSFSDYATLTSLVLRDGKLTMTEEFPITGESKTTLSKTENSRYGNYEIVDSLLDELQGTWQDEKGYLTLEFCKDEMDLGGKKTKVHILKSKSGYPSGYRIANADPSVYEWQGFSELLYDGEKIFARMIILDAPAPKIFTFSKSNE